MRRWTLSLVLAGSCLPATALWAYPQTIFEQEPNDTLEDAQSFRGEARLLGEVGGDDRDKYLWAVDDAESDQVWRLELRSTAAEGVLAHLSIPPTREEATQAAVEAFGTADETAEPDAAAQADDATQKLLTFDASERSPVVTREGLMVSHGEYLLTLTGEVPGEEYQFVLTPTGEINLSAIADPDTPAEELRVEDGRDWVFQLNGDEFALPLMPEEADEWLWHVSVRGELGAELSAVVVDADGEPLSDPASGAPLNHRWNTQAVPEGARLRVTREDGEAIGRLAVRVEEGAEMSEPEPEVVAASLGGAAELELQTPTELELTEENPYYLRFRLTAEQVADQAWALDVTSDDDYAFEVCLGEFFTGEEGCRSGPGEAVFDELQLAADDWYLRLEPEGDAEAPQPVTVTLRPEGLPADDRPVQPEDVQAWAAPLAPGRTLQGSFREERTAWFHLPVAESGHAWRFRAEGDGVDEVRIRRSEDRRTWQRMDRPSKGRGMGGAFGFNYRHLPADDYYLEVFGEPGDFQLTAEIVEHPGAGWEIEPNDDFEFATPLTIGEPMRGEMDRRRDEDYFRFSLPGDNRVAIRVTPPEEGYIRPSVFWREDQIMRESDWQEQEDGDMLFSQKLPAGDYYLRLETRRGAAEYEVQVDVVEPWAFDAGHPFAHAMTVASPMPTAGVIDLPWGRLDNDDQWFRLPVGSEDREIELVSEGGQFQRSRTDVTVKNEREEALEPERFDPDDSDIERAIDGYRFTIPAEEQWYLGLSRGGWIKVHVEDPVLNTLHRAREARRAAVEMELSLEADEVAAWAAGVQHVDSELRLHNTSDEETTLELKGHASHHGWHVLGLPEQVALAPGEDKSLALTWVLPGGIADDSPVFVFVDGDGPGASARADVDDDVAAVNEGGEDAGRAEGLVDLAWAGLGARFVDPEDGDVLEYGWEDYYLRHLIDGMSSAGSSVQWGSTPGEALPPLRLAGDGGTIEKLVFNQRSSHSPSERWREVEIEFADVPGEWEPLMTVSLDSRDGEQFFPLEAPVEARYLRIRPVQFWGQVSRRGDSGIGNLRVLGQPSGELAEARPNLLRYTAGGHWIRGSTDSGLKEYTTNPSTSSRSTYGRSSRARERGIRIEGDERVEMVFGFLQQRAALLDSLSWREGGRSWLDPEEDDDWRGVPVERVRVYTSTETPVGPWERHEDWSLERDDEGLARFAFDEPVWARYLRLEIHEPEPGEGRSGRYWRIPEELGAHEAVSPASGESILGYWGLDHNRGPFEAQLDQASWPEAVDDPDSHPDAPFRLDGRISARTEAPGDTRSYRVTLEEPDNTLAFRLRERLYGRLQAELVDADGESVPLDWTRQAGAWREAVAVDIPPGEYRLDITEPPRAVAFLWDASGSLSDHQGAIQQAASRFAERLQPGEEVANLMALGGPMLISDWADDARQLRRTLEVYDGRFDSSNSEPALQRASRELEGLDKDRIIFLITDAELMGRELSVWNDLERVQPRVFALEVSHGLHRDIGETRWYQNLMRSWSAVGGGRYSYSVDQGGLIQALEQGMRQVREPTTFFLEGESRYQEPPEPGTLRVVSGEQPVVPGGVVHLIFDASGSMLRQMEGGRRIEVAREIVNRVLDDYIPEPVPVALRAYGHTEPHSCETELLVEPSAGNHDEVRRTVNGIEAINLARTPLAASLDAVPDDLADVEAERRLVVMLTDGEETCDGDVAESVENLLDAGMDVRLNIVGFHIDEIGMEAEFERFAEQGGGEYFGSHDGDELTEGLRQALAAPYRVLDADGDEVGRGRVDDDSVLTLEVGEYEVVVDGADGEQRHALSIGPNEEVELAL